MDTKYEKDNWPLDNRIELSEAENIVLSGGGIKGVCYYKYFQILEENGLTKAQIKNVCGTSAGSIFATLYALGYDNTEIKELSDSLNFSDLIRDNEYWFKTGWDILNSGGAHSAAGLEALIKQKIQEKTGDAEITFGEWQQLKENAGLKLPDLHITVTFYDRGETGITTALSHKNAPNLKIWEAVRASISIPGLFEATKLNHEGKEYMVRDGGVGTKNYYPEIFDTYGHVFGEEGFYKDYMMHNHKTIGACFTHLDYAQFYNEHRRELPAGTSGELNELSKLIYRINSLYDPKDYEVQNRDRTTYIGSDIPISNFEIDDLAKKRLNFACEWATRNFLEKKCKLNGKAIDTGLSTEFGENFDLKAYVDSFASDETKSVGYGEWLAGLVGFWHTDTAA